MATNFFTDPETGGFAGLGPILKKGAKKGGQLAQQGAQKAQEIGTQMMQAPSLADLSMSGFERMGSDIAGAGQAMWESPMAKTGRGLADWLWHGSGSEGIDPTALPMPNYGPGMTPMRVPPNLDLQALMGGGNGGGGGQPPMPPLMESREVVPVTEVPMGSPPAAWQGPEREQGYAPVYPSSTPTAPTRTATAAAPGSGSAPTTSGFSDYGSQGAVGSTTSTLQPQSGNPLARMQANAPNLAQRNQDVFSSMGIDFNNLLRQGAGKAVQDESLGQDFWQRDKAQEIVSKQLNNALMTSMLLGADRTKALEGLRIFSEPGLATTPEGMAGIRHFMEKLGIGGSMGATEATGGTPGTSGVIPGAPTSTVKPPEQGRGPGAAFTQAGLTGASGALGWALPKLIAGGQRAGHPLVKGASLAGAALLPYLTGKTISELDPLAGATATENPTATALGGLAGWVGTQKFGTGPKLKAQSEAATVSPSKIQLESPKVGTPSFATSTPATGTPAATTPPITPAPTPTPELQALIQQAMQPGLTPEQRQQIWNAVAQLLKPQ